MTDQIKASPNTGLQDGIQATARYITVIVTFVIAVLALLKVRDIGGIITLIQNNGGEVLGAISGLISLAVAAYGIFKSHKRGAQVASVAVDPRVPEEVATTK